jgi:SMC interacting uncharacterized protein involved in chromosome segregation
MEVIVDETAGLRAQVDKLESLIEHLKETINEMNKRTFLFEKGLKDLAERLESYRSINHDEQLSAKADIIDLEAKVAQLQRLTTKATAEVLDADLDILEF